MEGLDLFLIYVVSILFIIIFLVLTVLVSWRLYIIQQRKTEEDQENVIEEKIFAYLKERIPLEELLDHLNNHEHQIPIFTSLCIQLLDNLEGRLEDKIHLAFDSETLRIYFKQRLDKGDSDVLANALLYYRYCLQLETSTLEKIKSLLSHQNSDIVFAASLALIKSKEIETQRYGLKKASQHKNITNISFSELLIIFSDPEMRDFNERGKFLLELVKADDTLPKFCPVIIEGMGEMNFYGQAPELMKLLSIQLEQEDRNEKMTCELIKALGNLHYTDVLPSVWQLLKAGSPKEKVSCIKALGALQTDTATKRLATLINASEQTLRYEAMLQLVNIGDEAIESLNGSVNTHQEESSIKSQTIQELKEIKQYQNG